jgi:phage terminase large subunit-like protein
LINAPDKAEKVMQFIGRLTHTKGEWGGKPFTLLPWQTDLLGPLFGTVKEDGSRVYRICYVEVPKKTGKSELGAAIALYMLCADGEISPEVYSAAADRDQASLVYNVAAQMVQNEPTLSKVLQIRDSRKRIHNPRNGGVYQVLSSEVRTKHGLNPSAVIFDELHAQPNDELWRVLTVGTDYARKQQLVFVMTTAGIFDVESIWWKVRQKARQIRDGIVEDPSFLPILYIADPDKDDPHDEELWKRVNPSLGRIFTLDKISADYEQAKNDLTEFEDFKRFRLNIPAKHVKRWMPMEAWDKCSEPVDLDMLKDRPCFGGLDLSSTIDLSAYALIWPAMDENDYYYTWVRGYCPEDTIGQRSRQDRIDYGKWVHQGHIVATPGNVIDYEFIKRDVLASMERFDVREIGYDPWNATQLSTDLFNNEGIQMVEVRQGAKTLSEPAKDILACVMSERLRHGGNPALRWCTDNLVMVSDANENIRPVKDKSTDRIDLFVALLIAWSRVIANMGNLTSIYESRGIITIGG